MLGRAAVNPSHCCEVSVLRTNPSYLSTVLLLHIWLASGHRP